jgi:hypothetical protein
MSDVTLAETRPRARIPHECDWCYRVIDPGETYRRTGGVFDGRMYTWKECAHCEAMAVVCDLWGWTNGDGLSADDFHEWEPADIFDARCKVMWKRKWRRTTDNSLYPVPVR